MDGERECDGEIREKEAFLWLNARTSIYLVHDELVFYPVLYIARNDEEFIH